MENTKRGKWSIQFHTHEAMSGYYVDYCGMRLSKNYETELAAIDDMQKQIEEHNQKIKTLADQLTNIANNGCKSNSDFNVLDKALEYTSAFTSNDRSVLSRFIHNEYTANDKRTLHQIIKHLIECESL